MKSETAEILFYITVPTLFFYFGIFGNSVGEIRVGYLFLGIVFSIVSFFRIRKIRGKR